VGAEKLEFLDAHRAALPLLGLAAARGSFTLVRAGRRLGAVGRLLFGARRVRAAVE
jgi:hypothetical protein